jgi:hypothetical protein
MNIPLTGLSDLFTETYNYHNLEHHIKNKNLIIEDAQAEQRYSSSKAKIGALQWVVLGLVSGYANEKIHADLGTALGIGLISSFAAVAVVVNLSTYASGLLEDDAKNYKAFHGEILKNNEIYNNKKNENELSVDSSYKLFMTGNNLSTGKPIDKIAFKIKEYISQKKATWDIEDNIRFQKIENFFSNFIKTNGSITEMLQKFVKGSSLKAKANEIIAANCNYNSQENEYFKKYIVDKHPTEQRYPKAYNKRLKEVNQEAILSAYEIIRKQNVELFFAKIVLDYNKGIIHKDIINQFSELHDKTKYPEKGDSKGVDIESYKNISKIAFEMKCGIKVYSKNTDVKVILNHINPNLVSNGKIKIHSFNDIFEFEKIKSIEKRMNLSSDNNLENKKINFNELEIDNKSFNEIVKITEKKLNQEKKVAEKIQEAKKNKI